MWFLLYQVGLFYLYFVFYELYQYCKRGHKTCCENFDSENMIHLINIGIYIVQMALTFFAYIQFPAESTVDGDTYINYKSYAEMTVLARYLNAINSLFVWFEVILYMSLVPAFALVLGESTFPMPSRIYPRSLFVELRCVCLVVIERHCRWKLSPHQRMKCAGMFPIINAFRILLTVCSPWLFPRTGTMIRSGERIAGFLWVFVIIM